MIDNTHIRLAGIDAPELDHPWGQQSKWALVKLCKGQTITARIKPELSYDRLVAECFLPDGRDLAAELVKAGLALDWPKFSGGRYRQFETPDARRRLWRASLRQGGLMPPAGVGTPVRIVTAQAGTRAGRMPDPAPETAKPDVSQARWPHWRGWLLVAGALVMLVGCNLIGRNGGPERAAQAPALSSFVVTASMLNVRNEPTARSSVIAQIGAGNTVIARQVSGRWYGIALQDGRTGWVHADYLRPTAQ